MQVSKYIHVTPGLKLFALFVFTLSISGCFNSPTVKRLVEQPEMMRVVKRAVKQEVPYSNIFPMTLRLGYLIQKGLIDKQSEKKIIKLTHCVNLNGVMLNVDRGELISIEVLPSECEAGLEG